MGTGKIGIHLQMPHGWPLVQRVKPRVLKVVSTAWNEEQAKRWRAARPDGLLIYRQWFPYETLSDWEERCAILAEGAWPGREMIDYVETPWNEAAQRPEELDQYAHVTVQAAKALRNIGSPWWKIAVGNFSTGNPADLRDWPLFYPALEVADALSLHEYDFPAMQAQESWKCLRYRRVLAALPRHLQRPILITECGLDSGDKRGWKTWAGADPAVYAQQLRWYRDELEKDSYVLGATVFTAGANEDWQDYEIDGAAEVEALLREEGRIFTEPEVTPMNFTYGPGFDAKLKELEDAAACNEVWTGEEFSELYTEQGRHLVYVKASNAVLVFPSS